MDRDNKGCFSRWIDRTRIPSEKRSRASALRRTDHITGAYKTTIDQPLLDNKSSKYQCDVASGGIDQHFEKVPHHITADLDDTCEYISSGQKLTKDGRKVHWDYLTDSPQELTLQDNEVVISCGIRFSPSGAQLNEPIKVTLDHNAHFTNPRREKIVFYTREKGSKLFVRIPSSTDGCPRCDVRSKDLDFYVDHFSDLWIVTVINRYFVGKRVECTPYVRPPVTKGFTHLVELCIYDDVLNVIEKTKEEMEEYRKLYASQQMLLEWRYGDINIKLFDGPKGNEEKIDEMKIRIKDIKRLERKQFSFEVKSIESRASQKFLKFTLDQKESPFDPTVIRFELIYDATTNVPTTTAAGAAFCPMYAPSEMQTLSGKVTNEEIRRLSNLLPGGKYSELFGRIKFNYHYIQKIKTKHFGDSTAASEELLQEWKTQGGSVKDLDAALRKADLEGLVSQYKNQSWQGGSTTHVHVTNAQRQFGTLTEL